MNLPGKQQKAAQIKRIREGDVSLLERVAIALFLALAGFLTAILAWWLLTPPVSLSMDAFLKLGAALGVIFFFYGLVIPEHAVDQLGTIWKFLWRISHEVLKLHHKRQISVLWTRIFGRFPGDCTSGERCGEL